MQFAALLCLLQQKKNIHWQWYNNSNLPMVLHKTEREDSGAHGCQTFHITHSKCVGLPSIHNIPTAALRNSSQQDRLCPRHTILGPQLLRCQQLAVMPPSSAQPAHSTPQHGRTPHGNPQVSSKATPSMCQDPQRVSSRAIKQHTTCKQHSTAGTHTGMHTVSRKARIGRDGTPQRRAAVTPPSCTRHAHSTSQ